MNKRLLFTLFALVILLLSSCSSPAQPIQHAQVFGDFEELETVLYPDSPVAINTSNIGTAAIANKLKLKLVATVESPVLAGERLQATSVDIDGNRAIVSYNMVGSKYLGAIDAIDLSNPRRPSFTRRTTLGADIHEADLNGDHIYLAIGFEDPKYPFTAAFLDVSLRKFLDSHIETIEAKEHALKGFVGTSVTSDRNYIYATSANKGGFSMISKNNFDEKKFVELEAARWVDVGGNNIAILQGNPARLTILNKNTLEQKTYELEGLSIPDAKASLEIDGSRVFVAAGKGGVQLFDLNQGKVVSKLDFNNDDFEYVANAVSSDRGLIFTSGGSAGVAVAQDHNGEMEILGQLDLGDHASVNHAVYSHGYLIVASGLGGVKIIKVSR